MKILIIEDDARFGEILLKWLDGFAREVVVVRTWEEAERYLGETKPDITWVDLDLPDSDPSTTILRIADVRTRDADMVIIVVSGYVDESLEEQARRFGVDAIERKGLRGTREKLLSLIMVALLNAQSRDPKSKRLAEILDRAAQFMRSMFDETGNRKAETG